MDNRYIVVEGPIGVGKTSLSNILAGRFGARRIFEIVEENPFLANFYSDRQKQTGTSMCCCVSRVVSAAPAADPGERPAAVLTIDVP